MAILSQESIEHATHEKVLKTSANSTAYASLQCFMSPSMEILLFLTIWQVCRQVWSAAQAAHLGVKSPFITGSLFRYVAQ